MFSSPLRAAKQLERFGQSEDIADLLLQVAIEVAIDRNLRDKIG